MSQIINKNIKSLTNKNKRDLGNDKEYFNNVVAKIIAEVLVKIKEVVRKDLMTSITPNQTVSTTINTSLINAKETSYDVECYVRVYYQKGQGADPETFDGLTVLNTKLISGRICAVDNSTIFLNSKIIMPDGREFLAKDTFVGSYVRPAIYLYFTTREEAEDYLIKIGANATNKIKVKITPPAKPKSVQDIKKPSNITVRGVNKKLV
jgi:3D (Asp-Asp-Asp) domain-containing protein